METDAGTPIDGGASEVNEAGPSVESAQGTPDAPQQGGGNPAWTPLRERLGEVQFRLLQPDLEEMDRKAQDRFQAIHGEYQDVKPFRELGHSYDEVQQWKQVIDLLNNDPVQFYNMLSQNPQIAETLAGAQDEGVEGEEIDGDDDPFDLSSNPQFQTLQQQNEQMMQMLQQRQQQEQQAQADAELETELNTYWDQHPEFSDDDRVQTLQTWAQMVNVNPNTTLEQAASRVSAYKQSILSAPRPGQSAPQVMPVNGSSPSPTAQTSFGKMSDKDTRSLAAQFMQQHQG